MCGRGDQSVQGIGPLFPIAARVRTHARSMLGAMRLVQLGS